MIHRNWNSQPDEPVSHNARVRKRVWIRNGEADSLTQVSRAVLPPGEVCGGHSHPDMWEMFLVEEGSGSMLVNGEGIRLCPGDCLVVAPGEMHELTNHDEAELVVLTIGWLAQSLGRTGV